MNYPSYEYEFELQSKGYKYICGVDEVGRGCIAGPVLAAAVILPNHPPKKYTKLIRDSKTLSESQRETTFQYLISWVKYYGIGSSSVEEIDNYGIVEATTKAMIRAIKSLKITPEFLLIDAMNIEELSTKQKKIIKGDSKSYSIAAASIIAKVSRDNLIKDKIHPDYPNYDLKNNKGYGTKKHIEFLKIYGPQKIHRKSFEPIKSMITVN